LPGASRPVPLPGKGVSDFACSRSMPAPWRHAAIIFVTMRRQTIAPRQKRQINAMAKIKTLVLLGNDPQDLRSASYGHLNNTPAVNQ